jgi:hypothetical protein
MTFDETLENELFTQPMPNHTTLGGLMSSTTNMVVVRVKKATM